MKIISNLVRNIYYYIELPILRQMIILDCMPSLYKNMSKILLLYLKLDYGRRRGHTIELQIPSTY